MSNADQAVRFAREALGIEHVHIAPGPRPIRDRRAFIQILNAVLEPLHHLHADGQPMPPSLVVDPGLFPPASTDHARFVPANDDDQMEIRINPSLLLWGEENRHFAFACQQFSTAHAHGTLYHEYMHFRIARASMPFYIAYGSGFLSLELADVAASVSGAAEANTLEFLSEIYAALETGHPGYNEEIMGWYRTLLSAVGLEDI